MSRGPVQKSGLCVSTLVVLLVTSCQVPTDSLDGDPVPLDPAGVSKWSDAASWPSGSVPVAGERVTIAAGRTITLDVSPPALDGLLVEGELEFARTDLDLVADWILVKGVLRVGTATNPFTQRATITLTGRPESEEVNGSGATGMGTRVLGVAPGGTLDLHGESRVAWTRLDGTVRPGATTLRVVDPVDWRVGERVVVAPSGFDPHEAEDREIVSIAGATITLDAPLDAHHFGALQTIAGWDVDQRAEVGLLNRNIRIQGPDDADRTDRGFGGHVMVLAGAQARVEGVEFVHMGQRGELARYPMHWHLAGDVSGQYFRGNSVWQSNNRCLTIHGSDNLDVRNNVCYDHMGHGYFLEEGAETGNHLEGNLGVRGRAPDESVRLLPSDARPATFWVTNPDNTLINNAAAGSDGIGFWYALPQAPLGPSAGEPDLPQTTPLGEFRGNVAHSNLRGGLFVDDGPREDGQTVTAFYQPRSDPADPESTPVTAVFDRFTAYKNGRRAVWLRGHQHLLRAPILTDNAIAATFASSESFIEDGLVAAQTANAHSTRSLYRGYEFYDGRVGARRVTFWGFSGTGDIPWSALGFNRTNSFSVSTWNAAQDLRFEQSNPVYLEAPHPNHDGDKAAVFYDETGSVTGTPGRYVVANTEFLRTSACVLRPAWNAQECLGPYVRLRYNGKQAVAPATATRDDGASEQFVGIGNDARYLSISMIEGRSYDLAFASAPADGQLSLKDALPGQWIGVSIPYPTASFSVVRDYWHKDVLVPVGSRSALDASDGDSFYYDAGAKRLYLKMVVREDRDWAHLRIEP